MSKKVDERVVEMRFDNKQFESATKESMSTLDKLKQKLQLKDATKGLGDLEKAARKVDLNPLSKAADTVTAKFSAMQVAGVTAIANLTNSAVNAGKNITKALTIEPVMTGFQEYETQIGAIQTILANTQKEGTNVERVNAALDELNLYADQTIYNFTEMTRNIGTFTAAGVKLDDSVSAIKGIANLAAVSGSTSLQASTAMYQLSQALAAGKVSLMDWNSVVNAGMGGQVFQDALIRTSENLKTGAKQAIATYGTFRESLTQGAWLTTEVLTETLGQLAGAYSEADLLAKGYSAEQAKEIVQLAETAKGAATDVKTFTQLWDTLKEAVQSGWGQTWRMIVGDFDEAKERMTKLSTLFGGIIEKASNRRNSMLSGALDSSWSKLTSKLGDAGIKTEEFQNRISELAKTHNVNLDEMIEKEGSFEKALKKAFSTGTLDKSILIDAIKSFTGGIKESADAAKAASNQMEKYGEIVDKVINGDFGNGEERVRKLTEAGYEYAAVQNLVNERLGSSVRHMSSLTDEQIKNADSLANLSDEQLKSKGYTDEQIIALKDLKKEADDANSSIYALINGFEKPSGVELAWGSVFNILDAITESCKAVKQAWTEIFHPGMTEDQIIAERSERLYKLLESIHAFTEELKVNEETAQKITRTFKGLFAILDLIRMVVGGVLNIGFRVLKEVLSAFDMDILDVTANVSDAIVAFHDWVTEHNLLAKAIQFIVPYVKQAVLAVSEWIKNNETIQNGISRLRSAFEDAVKGVQDWIASVKEADNIPQYIISGLVNGIKNGIGLAVQAIMELGKSILEGIKAVLGIHSPSTEFFEIGKNMIAGLINGIKEGISSLLSLLGDIGQKCIDVLSKIDFSKIFTFVISAGIIYAGKKIYDLAEKFAAPFEGLGKMFSGIGKMFSGLGNVFNQFAATLKVKRFEIISKGILNLAMAIGVLAASIYVLSNIEPAKLWTAVGAIAALAAIMGVLAFAMSKMSGASASIGKDGVKISGVKTALISLGVTLLLMAATVKMLGSLNPEQAKQGFLGLAGLVAAIGIVLLAFGTLVKGKQAQNIDKFGKTLIKMSAAMLLMVVVIKLIGGMSVSEIAKGVACIAAFGGIMVGLIALTKLAGKNIDKVGGTLLKMSAAMLVMVVVIKLISGMSLGEIVKGVVCIAAFGGIMAGLVALTKLAGGKDVGKIGTTILSMAAAMAVMAITIKLVAGMSLGEIVKGVVCIAAFGGIIVGLIAATRLAGEGELKRVASTILAMSISIGILAAISVLLGLVDIATLKKGITAVAILGTIMAGMVAATRGAENVKGNIIAMTVAIGIMAAAVIALSFIEPTKLAGATAAMGILMSIFAIMLKVAGTAQAAIGPLLVMSLAVGLIAGIVALLSQLPIESVLGSAAALSILLLSMTASLAILSAVGPTIGQVLVGVVGLLAIAVPLMAFVGVLAVMQNVKNAMSNAIILATFATVMTGLLVVLTGIGVIYMATAGIAATGILGLLAMAVPLMAFVGVLAVMQGVQNAEANANILISLMTAMTTLLTVVSVLGPLALVGVTAITAMSVVMVALAGLVVAVGALNEKFPQLETFLDSGIALLTKLATGLGQVIGSFISGFAQAVTSGLPEIATTLSEFMMNLSPFIEGAKMIDESVLTNVKTLAEVILALTGTGLLESIATWINGGESPITEFAALLVPFGQAMVDFSNTVSGIDESAVTAAANAGKMLAEMAESIPREGGWWGEIAGEKDMASFGNKLVAFGESMKKFSATISTGDPINEAAITVVANAGKKMTELNDSIPKTGGWWQDIAGEKDISDFGHKMVAYGTSIKEFAALINGLTIDEAALSSLVTAGMRISDMQEYIPKTGGWWGEISGEKDISDFGKKIVSFGKSIVTFSESISGKLDGVEGATKSINNLMRMFRSVSSVNSDAISSFKQSLSELGMASIDGFIEAFNGGDTKAQAAITKFLNGVSSAVNGGKDTVYTDFVSVGSYLVDGFCNGITDNTFKAEAKARAMAKAAYDAARAELDVNSPSKKFMTIGKSVATGLAKGITKNVGTANKASVKMANGVLASTQEALGIHSPSVVFDEKVGRYIVQGIAEGIKKDMSAEEAAEKKAQNIVNAFQKAFDKIKLKRSNREKAAKLWGLTGGKGASAVDTLKYDQQKLNDDLWDLTQEAKLAEDKWILLRDTFGEESKYAQEAYGEWLDIQIEAAETGTKLSEATKSFVDIQNELMQDLKTINENDLKIFELMQKNGKVYSNAEIDDKNLTTLRNNLNAMETVRNNAYKEYERIGGQYADPNDENVRNAKKAWQEAEIAVQEANLEIREYEQSIADRMIEGIDNQISFREDFIKQWEARNKYASTKQKNMFYTNMYDMEATDKWVKLKWLEKDHEDLVKRIAKDNNISIEEARKTREATKNYYEKVFPAQTDYLEANNKLKDKRNEVFDQEIQNIEDDKSNREELKRRWEATYGRDASDEERYQFEWQMATANIKERKKTFGVYTKEYVQLIKDIAKEKNLTLEEAAQTEQATEFKNKYVIPAENDALEAENERHDLKMDRLEQEKENRKTEYETASDIADLKYQIWELTTGREAKDEEKETMKLAVLAEQLGNQAKLVDMARNKWKSAKSEDKLKYEKEYWDARLELANLQSDVLDIQESITKRQERALDRQRKAQDDYDNYLKKYEQYYLDHGMTLEELEKDARLVSGYDPDKVITTAANKTNTAIENVRNNVANLTKAVGEGIQNGISDVTDNTSSMLDACAKTLNEEKDTWFKAGASMVDGLTEGITSKMQAAVDTVTELITKMLAAIQDVASNGINYTASVTPVLDTSSIYNQASRSGNMVSDRQLKLVQAIRQGVDYSRANSGASANVQSTDPTYTFVQNNYSPKALSSLDIYRQTNNMISRIGKKVNQ